MNAEALTHDRILDTAEDVLRRFGPAKTTVVDVARALGVSHGTIYRHFPSKAALRDAVAQRWLARVANPLATIAEEQGPASERLYRWLTGLSAAKRHKVLDDPELFATYHGLAEQARDVVDAHVNELIDQIARIVDDGVTQGEFVVGDVATSARAVFDATIRFHHPAHSREWSDPGIDDAFEAVWTMLLAALTPPHAGNR